MLITTIRIVAITGGLSLGLIFLFVGETFWDRTPVPRAKPRRPTLASLSSMFHHSGHPHLNEKVPSPLDVQAADGQDDTKTHHHDKQPSAAQHVHHPGGGTDDIRKLALGNATAATIAERRKERTGSYVGFADQSNGKKSAALDAAADSESKRATFKERQPVEIYGTGQNTPSSDHLTMVPGGEAAADRPLAYHSDSWKITPRGEGPKTPSLHTLNSPFYSTKDSSRTDHMAYEHDLEAPRPSDHGSEWPSNGKSLGTPNGKPAIEELPSTMQYTHHLRTQPPKTFVQTLQPWNGRLRQDKWLKVAMRPFILFAYPSILWSTVVYATSIGWLIVLSETVSVIFRDPSYSYQFSALGTGLVYISPFIGGILGTAVAGKFSDLIVRFMTRRNDGIYEPEFRLIMAIPITIATVIGLMGFGWSAEEKDKWIVPTVFFGIISFGCSLGSTTAITFAVDSYRQYAGEALVTLNFSKSTFFSLL